jgi:hypothetical protein
MLTEKLRKTKTNKHCDACDYSTERKSSYDKHLLSSKHKNNTKTATFEHPLTEPINNFICNKCNKLYNSRVGLWYHIKKCIVIVPNEEDKLKELIIENNIEKPDIVELLINENKEFKNVIIDLVKSNQDLQKQMLEVCQNSKGTINSHNNSHNKTFNLNFFLNEQCKDAMNIMEFVDTFQLQFSDLERIGEVGYVEGISSLVIDKLNKMDIYKRPIHCSDAKREIMHIKDNDVWSKDTENNDKLRLALKHITKKNMDLIGPWVENHPGVRDYDHRLNDKYTIIIIESMGGKNNNTMFEGESKIIKKISKMVLIDKSML